MENVEKSEEQTKMETDEKDPGENWDLFTVEFIEKLLAQKPDIPIGYLIWTKYSFGAGQIYEYISALQARGIQHLRTGISWIEWKDEEGKAWIKKYIREYAKYFHLLPCLTFTPLELGIRPGVNSPPKNPETYGEFVKEVIEELGETFTEIELWNEWNLETDWDATLDPEYRIFEKMMGIGGKAAHAHGKKVVIGGASRVTRKILPLIERFSLHLSGKIDVIGFHNLRGTWSDSIPSEALGVQSQNIRNAWKRNIPTYLTEYGFPVTDPENRFDLQLLEDIQVALFAYAVYACLTKAVEKVYWYTYKDQVSPSLRFLTTGWEDTLQYYFGDTQENGTPRKLGKLLLNGGPENVLRYAVKNNLMPLVDAASLCRKIPVTAVA